MTDKQISWKSQRSQHKQTVYKTVKHMKVPKMNVKAHHTF